MTKDTHRILIQALICEMKTAKIDYHDGRIGIEELKRVRRSLDRLQRQITIEFNKNNPL